MLALAGVGAAFALGVFDGEQHAVDANVVESVSDADLVSSEDAVAASDALEEAQAAAEEKAAAEAQAAAEKEAQELEARPYRSSNVTLASGTAEINLFSAWEETSQTAEGESVAAVQAALDAFRERGYDAGFVVLDLTTGKGLGCNADTRFFTASTIKVPYIAFMMERCLDTGTLSPDETVCEYESIRYSGTGVMYYDDIVEYPLATVIDNTILYSDNTGYALLRELYSGLGWSEWVTAAGVDYSALGAQWYPYCSARDLAKFWLAIGTYFEEGGENAAHLEELLGSTEISFLRQTLGERAAVTAKAGFEINSDLTPGMASLNDAGFVTGEAGTYLVAIMSNADYDTQYYRDNEVLITNLIAALDAAHAELLAE